MPDTEQLKPATVSKLIKQYPALYLKPFAKSLGRGVLKCAALPENKWQIRFQKNGSVYQRTLDQEKALPFIRHICDNRYLVQQAISVVHEDRRPIDFRVSVQKGGRGEWGVTGIVARVGLDRAIVTNVAAGGTCVPARPLLKKRFPHQHDAIYAQMRDVAIRVAAQLEKHDPTCADLGLDLAVDEDGHIWFIEVNGRDLRITFRHAGELNTWHNTFRRPMEYAAFLKKKQKILFHPDIAVRDDRNSRFPAARIIQKWISGNNGDTSGKRPGTENGCAGRRSCTPERREENGPSLHSG